MRLRHWVISFVSVPILMGAVACGSAEQEPTPAPETAPAPAAKSAAPTPAAPTPAPAPASAPAPSAPTDALLAGTYPSGNVRFNVDPPVPTSFSEAPELAALVKQGTLPPVEQRLPEDPLVLAPPHSIGKYGGTWRRIYLYVGDHGAVITDQLQRFDGDGATIMPHLAKSVTFSDGGRTATITIRTGHKWSDGEPFTTDDFEWQWNNLLNNEEFRPTFPSGLLSPITKNKPTLNKIDDVTVSLTWDDPYYSLTDNGLRGGFFSAGGGGYLFSPAHYLEQFHPDFADMAKLEQMMAEAEVDNWVKLIKLKLNAYTNPDLPQLSAWVTERSAKQSPWTLKRNPYYFAVDTAGNQLPYIDELMVTMVEDQEVAALKIAAGEVDFQSRQSTIEKLPVYLKNADANGYHLTFWPNSDPTTVSLYLNQAWNADPVIGELIHTRDFRKALSMGLDRETIKETFLQGMGEARAFVPSKGTPYYPGDEYAYPDYIKLDVEKANQLLDSIVLKGGGTIKGRDSNGFRLRPDGQGPLTLHHSIRAGFLTDFTSVSEIAIRNWEKLGIKGTLEVDRLAGNKVWDNEAYLFPYFAEGSNPWISAGLVLPTQFWGFGWSKLGRFYETGGAEGVDPDQDLFINPEGENPLLKLLDLYDSGKKFPTDSPERIEIGKEIFRIHSKEVFSIPTVADTPAMKGIFPTNNDFKNVPEKTVCCQGYWGDGPRPELYYFDR